MRLLNHHKWIRDDYYFKTWHCEKCGCVRYWDMILEKIVFIKDGKQLYSSPECKSIINGDRLYEKT